MSPRLHTIGLFGILVACGSSTGSEGATTTACEPNPELTIGVQSRSTGDALIDNGVRLNGVKFNGVKYNGIKLNGVRLNGVKINGVKVNGVRFNGVKVNGVRLNGGELEGVRVDGTAVAGEALVGATVPAALSDGSEIELRIAAIERSADGTLAYYRLEHEGQNICENGEAGLFLPGVWDDTAARHDELPAPGGVMNASFSCKAGVLAKCVDWGYAPWSAGADMHQACTRMGRADYCGTGTSYTKDGTAIDVFDTTGIQSPTVDASMRFEAAWGTNGALCVSRTRYDARTPSGDAVVPSCWATLPRCESLADATARFDAKLGNASRVQSRSICAP